jgi:hypothetical protein
MNATQRAALMAMDQRNVGAIITRFGWTWPEDVRSNPEAAKEVFRKLCGEVNENEVKR